MLKQKNTGLTLVEITVTISIMLLLATIGFVVRREVVARADATEETSDAKTIARVFEQYYSTKVAANGPSYPSTADISNQAFLDENFPGSLREALISPYDKRINKTTSFYAMTHTGPLTTTQGNYYYQPFTNATTSTLCTNRAVDRCVRFIIWYYPPFDSSPQAIHSRHQQ